MVTDRRTRYQSGVLRCRASMRYCGIGSPPANTDVSGEEDRAGQEEEDPTEQPDHVTVTYAAVSIRRSVPPTCAYA